VDLKFELGVNYQIIKYLDYQTRIDAMKTKKKDKKIVMMVVVANCAILWEMKYLSGIV
jgi:hypothetical protein